MREVLILYNNSFKLSNTAKKCHKFKVCRLTIEIGDFVNRFKELRLEKKLSQRDLGKILFVCQQSIHNYENGKFMPSKAVLQRMADYYEVSTDYLLGLVDVKTPVNKMQSYVLNETETKLVDAFRKLPLTVQLEISDIVSFMVSKSNKGNKTV